nr:amino acid synthesis family protein [Roseobacter litoralis]
MLGAPAVYYGKAALVGSSEAMEHGAALLHPRTWQTGASRRRWR